MIRDVMIEELHDVELLERQCFSNPWNYEQLLYELDENPFASFKVLIHNHKIIGYMNYWITFECCQLNKIAICEGYRRQGYAGMLMDQLIHEAQKEKCEIISLEVRVSNQQAQHFYKKFNFIKMNIRKEYYSDGEDALIMVKAIGGYES